MGHVRYILLGMYRIRVQRLDRYMWGVGCTIDNLDCVVGICMVVCVCVYTPMQHGLRLEYDAVFVLLVNIARRVGANMYVVGRNIVDDTY